MEGPCIPCVSITAQALWPVPITVLSSYFSISFRGQQWQRMAGWYMHCSIFVSWRYPRLIELFVADLQASPRPGDIITTSFLNQNDLLFLRRKVWLYRCVARLNELGMRAEGRLFGKKLNWSTDLRCKWSTWAAKSLRWAMLGISFWIAWLALCSSLQPGDKELECPWNILP